MAKAIGALQKSIELTHPLSLIRFAADGRGAEKLQIVDGERR
jgi:hypothetical protein